MSLVQSCVFLTSHYVMHLFGHWLSHDLNYLKPGYSCIIVLALFLLAVWPKLTCQLEYRLGGIIDHGGTRPTK